MSDQKNPRQVFERVISLLKSGARAEAESVCRESIQRDPGDVNFMALLGTILAERNEWLEAEECLRHAIRVAPGHARAHEDLGTVLLNQGQHAAALPLLEKAAELMPNNPAIFTKLGGALSALGRSESAQRALAKASALSPTQAKLEQASRLFAEGKFRAAEQLAQAILQDNPMDVNAALLLARIAINAHCFDDAEQLLLKITEIAPRFVAAWHDLSSVLKELNRYEEAVVALEHAVTLDQNNPVTHYFLGAALAMAAQPERAIESYQKAVAFDSNLTGAHIGLGHVLKTVGDQAGGIAAYRRAIALRPNFGETYYSLANLKTFQFNDAEIADMASRLESAGLPIDCQVHFAFTLGKAYEDKKDFDQSFHYYALANKTHRNSIAYDPVQTEIAHQKMKEAFGHAFFDQQAVAAAGCQRPDPIFILGLPRSGSTLLEQILASHSLVDGTSELPDISMIAQSITDKRSGRSFPLSMPELAPDALTAFGEQYLAQTQRHRGQAPFFTDKMPNNFAYVGFIKAILPNAKIIDARRHPMDSCIGCFKQHFAKGQTFTYDLFELGEFYLEYEQLMTHWDDVLPGQVLHVQYESVVADLETQVRRILDFCGLEFEDNCVNFHETKRAVRTASSEQVRQPIYQGSVATWKRFGPHLDELRQVLSPVLSAEDQWVPGS
ncbi:MAG: tetratricopeptide repeat protein [Gammaproteobacteria bacterium]|jgi:tetratricopeptide (TPR) repeat protein|nr:tetratricopeptide repeat protein [Gammaproteobacteria bacterium]